MKRWLVLRKICIKTRGPLEIETGPGKLVSEFVAWRGYRQGVVE